MPSIARELSWLSAISLVLAGLASTQSIQPSNDTAQLNATANGTTFDMTILPQNNVLTLSLDGLTQNATNQKTQLSGNLWLTTDQTVSNLISGQIAFLPCDSTVFNRSGIDANKTVSIAISKKPVAIVLYSSTADHCMYNASSDQPFGLVYTAFGSDQTVFERMLHTATNPTTYPASINNTSPILVRIEGNGTSSNVTGPASSIDNLNGQSGGTPTTAVAMIVLYSITGLITALFLVIIVSGAIRAHRHPERYGPRALARFGRPPQSRARGIARAVLDSIPIVKFGDNEGGTEAEPKPQTAGEGIELRDAEKANLPHQVTDATDPAAATGTTERMPVHALTSHSASTPTDARDVDGAHLMAAADQPTASSSAPASGLALASSSHAPPTNADPVAIATNSASTVEESQGKLTCSICTEDFVRGEDIRLLPCDHRFHPDCVDPWLLNVSGTCPLCRIDLRPPEDTQSSHPPPIDVPDVQTSRSTFGEDRGAVFSPGSFSSARPTRRGSRRADDMLHSPSATVTGGSVSAASISGGPSGGTASAISDATADEAADVSIPTAADGDPHHRLSGRQRLSRYLEWHGIVNASRPERIAFLRRLREQRRQEQAGDRQALAAAVASAGAETSIPEGDAVTEVQDASALSSGVVAAGTEDVGSRPRGRARLGTFLRGSRVRTVAHPGGSTVGEQRTEGQ